jgi:rhodanese-related sulfurtransferase
MTAVAITRDDLNTRIAAGQPIVIVEALPESYFVKERLPGAINIPHDRIRELAPRLLPDKGAEIVTYCASATCRNSHIAAEILGAMGYTNVKVYAGGKQDWLAAGLPIERGPAPARAA